MKQEPFIDLNVVQSILDFLPMGVYVLNRERKVQWVNRRIIHRLQKENVSRYPAKYCYKEIFKRKTPCENCPALKTFETGLTEHTEIKSYYRGEMRNYLITTSPLRKSKKEKEAFIIETVQDITYKKKADEELRRLNDFNAAIINNAPVAILPLIRPESLQA